MMQAVLELLMDAMRRRLCDGSSAFKRIDYRRNRLRTTARGCRWCHRIRGFSVKLSVRAKRKPSNLTGIMTAVRTMWFRSDYIGLSHIECGTITDWMKDSYSIFLLQSGLSRAQVYLGILTATWLLLGAFIALTTFSHLELLLETKLKVEFVGIRQAGFASWLHLLAFWRCVLPCFLGVPSGREPCS